MWLMMMETLCEKLNLSINEVEDYNYIGALNFLSMNKERDEYINSLKE